MGPSSNKRLSSSTSPFSDKFLSFSACDEVVLHSCFLKTKNLLHQQEGGLSDPKERNVGTWGVVLGGGESEVRCHVTTAVPKGIRGASSMIPPKISDVKRSLLENLIILGPLFSHTCILS